MNELGVALPSVQQALFAFLLTTRPWQRHVLVIAAGAVVGADRAPNCLYARVPARRIRELDPVVKLAQQDEGLRP